MAVALSKGLGAPGGTVLAGPRDLMPSIVRYRRMAGGAMRQIGFFAAAGLYALEHNVQRLADDHANTRLIAERLAASAGFEVDLASVQTNILVFTCRGPGSRCASRRRSCARARCSALRQSLCGRFARSRTST